MVACPLRAAAGIATTVGETRVVGEFEVELTQDGGRSRYRWRWSSNVTWTLDSSGSASTTANGRSSATTSSGQPLLSRDPNVREFGHRRGYQAALAAGDTDRITATFESDGCFREPAGGDYRVCGTDVLHEFFAGFFAVGGGIILEHCTVTEDGTRTALEFNAVKWGTTDMPPQAGVAVYERGETGRLREARVYDDVDPPLD